MVLVRSPRLRTPDAPPSGFRRTMHVAVGPDGDYGPDAGPAVGAPRSLHAGIRDLHDGQVADEVRLRAAVGGDDLLTTLTLGGAQVDDLVGRHAVHGFRRHIIDTRARPDRPEVAVLLEVPVGAALSGYARMQAGRQSGRSTSEVIDAEALPVLADSCAGWASDGEMMTRIREGGYRPPRLPPEVFDADVSAWHDLGELGPWWVRRRRLVDIVPEDGRTRVAAAFRDSWVDADGIERSLHEWEVDLDVVGGVIAGVEAQPRSLPFDVCPQVAGRLGRLVGAPVADLRDAVRTHLAGVAGCTHLNDLLGVVPAAVDAAAGASSG
jgi:hypothetical protein